ncbi:MAG: ABC transporter substrate-binding protein [Caulobacterales bacterium]|nr:ABC transporter substrate-binding protein [Caulobacterales bacterium]
MTWPLPDRRHAALGLLAAALTPAVAFARARDPQAEQFVQTEGQKALSVVANRAVPASARDAAFRQMIDQLADFQRITGFVLGKYARVATPAQRQQFNSVFRVYAQNLFQSHLAGFKGNHLQVTGSVVRGPGDVVVNTTVSGDPSAGPLPVAWRVLGGPGSYKAVDVQTRGVWLAITLQQDFVSTIDNAGGDVTVLITRLQRETARRG